MLDEQLRAELKQRRRRGCLSGCLAPIWILIAAGLAYVALCFLFAPYNFRYGGYFHILPGWQGQGTIHVPSAGGDYSLYLHIEPKLPGYQESDIHGTAVLCTPRNEKITLTVTGDLPRNRPRDTVGVPLDLTAHRLIVNPLPAPDYRPELEFYGTFGEHKLMLEDRGRIPTAFRADGTLFPMHASRPWSKEVTRFTLNEVSWWASPPACGKN